MHDPSRLLVLAITQLLEEAEDREQLDAVARKIAGESLSDAEREELRQVYRECVTALDVVW